MMIFGTQDLSLSGLILYSYVPILDPFFIRFQVVSDTGNHCIKYYARNREVKTINLNVEFPIGTCLTSDSRLIIIDWKGAKMLRNGKISAPVSGSRVAKIYKGECSSSFYSVLTGVSVNWDSGEATRKGKILRGIQMPWNLAYNKLTDKIYVIGTVLSLPKGFLLRFLGSEFLRSFPRRLESFGM